MFATILVSCGTKKENLIPALSETERAAAEKLGKSMVKIGFGSLSTELNTQISFKGIDGDVSACHLKANSTINSVAEVNNVSIQRV